MSPLRIIYLMFLFNGLFCMSNQSANTNEPLSEPETTSEPESGPETTNEPASEPETTNEPTSELETTGEPEPKTTSEPETTNELASEPETTGEPASGPETTGEPVSEPETTGEPTSEPETTGESISEPETTGEPTSQPEGTGEPVSEPETIGEPISEPETTGEPASQPETAGEPTSEPETSGEPTSEPETTGEPGSEPETTGESGSEPETTGEPASEPETASEPASEPETAGQPTSEPNTIGEPTSEPETTGEPGSEPETTGEPTSEPETASEPASEPEVTNEPSSEPEATNEPASEPETTNDPASEPESTSEPETISESESSPEPGTVPENNSTYPEPDGPEPEVSSEPEKIAQAEVRPSATEIIVPPFMLMVVILCGLFALLLRSKYTAIQKSTLTFSKTFIRNVISNRSRFNSTNKATPIQMINIDNNNLEDKDHCISSGESFFTAFDLEVMESLKNSYNRPKELFRIALPALLSLALCPLTLYMYVPVTEFLWPSNEHASKPDINDAIACFLAPAGLVYATSFGFAFQSAISKQHEILMKMTSEISMIDQIATFTAKLRLPTQTLRMDVYRAIKTEAIFMILQILDRDIYSYKNQAPDDLKVRIWSVFDSLRSVNTSKDNYVDRCLSEKIVSHIMALNSICSDRMGVLHARIHPVKWMFLETLGFFSFIGILLLNAFSYRMELLMCIITVFSISMLCFVVSDLDSPFSGFFRVDLSVMHDVIERLAAMHELAKTGENGLIFYPERSNGKHACPDTRPTSAEVKTDKYIKDCW